MKDRGFTLIELLAVIVILAIIAVIATPIITEIIEDSKKASFERSAEGVVEATKFDITNRLTEEGYTYQFENGNIDLGANIKVSNAKNLSGTIKYNSEGDVSYAIHNDKWCIIKKNNEVTTSDYTGECLLEAPIIDFFTYEDNGSVALESFEAGDNCINYFYSSMSEEEATIFCSGGKVEEKTFNDFVMSAYNNENVLISFEELKAIDLIQNVVISDTITITDYDINKGGVDVVIPSKIDGKLVVAIGTFAFERRVLSTETSTSQGNIKSVVIPSTVKSIGAYAFANNEIESVTLPNDLETIEEYAFENNKLISIEIPNSVTSIGANVFRNNQLTSIVIPSSVTFIGNGAFENNNLMSITISEGITGIEPRTFANNFLTSITIPDSVKFIGGKAFASNQLMNVTIPSSVEYIDADAFSSNQLINVVIESANTEISCDSFNESSNLMTINIAGVDTSLDSMQCTSG